MPYLHICKRCGSSYFGRKNKIFCTPKCKAEFNNNKAADFRKELRDTDKMKNAYLTLKVIRSAYPPDEPILYEELILLGINETIPSRVVHTPKNNYEYRIIHGLGYRFVDKTKKQILIHSREEIEEL